MSVYYKFIGDFSTAKLTKNQQFCVEVSDEEQKRISTWPYPEYLTAKLVVLPSSRYNCYNWMVGDVVHKFMNPYFQMHTFGFPAFIRVPEAAI